MPLCKALHRHSVHILIFSPYTCGVSAQNDTIICVEFTHSDCRETCKKCAGTVNGACVCRAFQIMVVGSLIPRLSKAATKMCTSFSSSSFVAFIPFESLEMRLCIRETTDLPLKNVSLVQFEVKLCWFITKLDFNSLKILLAL